MGTSTDFSVRGVASLRIDRAEEARSYGSIPIRNLQISERPLRIAEL